MPVISVIIPVYNVEMYINCCLDSILTQTFADFELILVDDGSPDNSGVICDEYAAKDSRIRVIHQPNRGVSVARNQGVAASKGEYVTFVDSDDWLDDRFLERLYNKIIDHEADMCVMHIQKTEFQAERTAIFGGEESVFSSRQAIERYCRDYNEKILGPMAKLMRREIALNNPFPEDRSYAEDLATTYRWYHNSDRIVDLTDRLYYYRVRQESAVRSQYSINKLANLDTMEELMLFFSQNDYKELYVIFVHKYLFDLARQYKDIEEYVGDLSVLTLIKGKMKCTIRQCRKKCTINWKNDPDCYNLLYPKRMYIYWTIKGVISSIQRKLVSIVVK